MDEGQEKILSGKEERMLLQWAAEPSAMPDSDALDAAILRGIRQGESRKRRRSISRAASIAACAVLLSGVLSVRFSTSVAAYVGQFPLLKPLVELIHQDKGLQRALENDFFQPVGLSEEQGGVTVTVDGIVADDSRILVFLSLEDAPLTYRHLRQIQVRQSSGQQFWTSVAGHNFNAVDRDGKRRGTIDISLAQGAQLPDELELDISFADASDYDRQAGESPVWSFRIPVDKSRFQSISEEHRLNRTIEAAGQRILFDKLTVYPTRMDLELAYAPENTMKIFALENIRVEDENGEVLQNGANNLLSTRTGDKGLTLHFQSGYFLGSKHLTLKADGIRALDKELAKVVVDLKEGQLLSGPDSSLSLDAIGQSQDGYTVLTFSFEPKTNGIQEAFPSFAGFSWTFSDASGQQFQTNMMSALPAPYDLRSKDARVGYQYYLPAGEYKSPITIELNDYPLSYKADISVTVK